MISLVGLGREELTGALTALGVPERQRKMRLQQLWNWIYFRGAQDFGAMSNVAGSLRGALAARYSLARPAVASEQISADGTRKWLVRFADGELAETVFIPEDDRGTLCVSSQVGCTLNCRFCHTGTQRLVRNLSAAEIVAQVMIARDALGEWPTAPDGRRLSNIVMKGMGEPLYNFDNVCDALAIMMDHEGLSLSRRRITLSTAGVVPMMERCGRQTGVNLAVSLHAVRDELRDELVPLNKKYPIDALLTACAAYPGANNARRITLNMSCSRGSTTAWPTPASWCACCATMKFRPRSICCRSTPGRGWPMTPPGGRRSRPFPNIFSTPASRPRSASRAAATSWPPAVS